MITDEEGVYTKTQAYNFLKDQLGLSKKCFINKKFFQLFFKESDGVYLIRKTEDLIKNLFTTEGIVELNKMYYLKKQENNPEAEKIAETIMNIVRISLAA